MKSEIIYGIHPIHEALRAGKRKFHGLFVCQKAPSGRLSELIAAAESRRIPVEKVQAAELNRLAASEHHQGLAARVTPFAPIELDKLLALTQERAGDRFLIMLDGVTDPQNFGAVIRTAVAAGIDGIIIPRDRTAGPTPTVSKASAGALEHSRIVRVTNMSRTIHRLKDLGMWIYGLDPRAEVSIYSTDFRGPVGLVVGGEAKGMRPRVRQHCDQLVSIPLVAPVESLNASAAAALAIYEVFRQRHSS
jgi:23S rRNA (guanosine2251-2'-O)-methyltransferase